MLEDSPSAIYDSMATALGIERVAEARERLRRARLDEEKPAKELGKAKGRLLGDLAASTDDRASEASTLLDTRSPDLARLEELAFGQPRSGSSTLAALVQLPRLAAGEADQRAQALAAARTNRAQVAETDVARSGRVAALLRQALDHHAHHGDGPCPVCGTGALDQSWRVRAEAEAQAMETASRQLRDAESALTEARRAAKRALVAPPPALTDIDRIGNDGEIDDVSLERVTLEGQATRRRVDLDVTVDGTATSALGVMSQGELHALALALFLPRVSAVESPFRFLVIDDRLPAACRRLDIPADITEISRRVGSRVTAIPTVSPAEKAIGDAYALARTERLPAPLERQVVPMHCRRALEAQIRDLVWVRLLGERTHAQVEALLDDCDTTNHLLALLFFGQRRSPDEVYDHLDRLRPGAAKQLRFLNGAAHDPPTDLNPEALTGTVRNLMTELREAAW